MNNMRFWDQLKTTDPAHTKKVEFGRKFTSINSQWQLQRMTEEFGPVGEGWGYIVNHSVERIHDDYILAIADVEIWWGDRDSVGQRKAFGPVRGMSPIVERGKSGLHFDDDAGKKAMTDALTKGLSHLGVSADVFLGLYDDNKYVQSLKNKAAAPPADPPSLPPEDKHLLKTAGDTRSQYEVDKRKAAEAFASGALAAFEGLNGSTINDWYRQAISPKGRSTNRDALDRMRETFPDLADKVDAAAEEVRLRGGARLQ